MSPEYKKAMDLLELWVLLKTQYGKHFYNGQWLTQLQRKFTHITYNANEAEITIGIWSDYPVRKVEKNQAEDMSIEYRTNNAYALEEVGKVPASKHILNFKRR